MLDKKKSIYPIVILIIAGIGWGIKALIPTEIAVPISQPTATPDQKNPAIEKITQAVTVRVLTESAPGSGVTILQRRSAAKDRQKNIYTVLTCEHVVAESKQGIYRVLLPDGKIYPARLKSATKFKGLDLAVVEFESETIYQVVKLGDSQKLMPDSSVYATGFPNYHVVSSEQIEETSSWGQKAFRFTSGKVGLIAPRSLQEGYSLGYTNEVELGMSGGPVFNDKGELVGINGRLKYPIQGIEAFVFADGSKPSVEKFQQMEALSWAIPIATYQHIAEK
jgi:serine protease Do